ncbi:MAG: hypothetical protein ACKVWV_03895 [Planctomycetota bacterium]
MLHVSKFALALGSCLLGSAAHAQLSLPSRNPDRPRGNLAPHVLCRACGARNYTFARDGRKDADGFDLAWCAECKRETAHVSPAANATLPSHGSVQRGGLSLPRRDRVVWVEQEVAGQKRWIALPAGAIPRSATEPSPPRVPVAAPAAPSARAAEPANVQAVPPTSAQTPVVPAAVAARCAAIFDRVARLRSPHAPAIDEAVAELIGLGPDGFVACRAALERTEATVVVAAGRVLVRSGETADLARVERRLATRLPAAAGGILLDALIAADPVAVTPRDLVELLDAPQASVRQAAQRRLRSDADADLLPLLAPALASRRAETRSLALALVADVPGPAALDILMQHLADPTAKVAAIAITELAAREDDAVVPRLLGLAFRQRWILRENAFAVLALVEREDLRLVPILDDSHAESLLESLQSTNPFVAGVCASALAGIGFRSENATRTTWLDRTVVDRLIATVAGQQYHDDFTALQAAALRRLQVISGQTFERDGPRWVQWWVSAREGFFARRAFIAVESGDERRLVLRLSCGGTEDVALVAEDTGHDALADARNVVYVTETEARDLLAVLAREGALGRERLPGSRGSADASACTLAFSIGGRGKAFSFGAAGSESWFERLTGAVRDVAERNRWQRYAPPGVDRRGYWRAECVWWSVPREPLEGAIHLKEAVLATSAGRPIQEGALEELERMPPGALVEVDAVVLASLVRFESQYSERVRRLVTLAARAAGADEEFESGLSVVHAKLLCDALVASFPDAAADDLARVARSAGPDFARGLARESRSHLRAAAARALGGAPEDASILVAMLEDTDVAVATAAIESLGKHRVEAARTELIVRARLGSGPIRAAALEAVAKLGGDYVLEALAIGAADADPRIQVAAARGLAELGGSGNIALLVTLLAQPNEEVADAARNGLMRAGQAAWPELLRVLHAPAHRARRAVAITLAQQGVPDAASVLMTLLSSEPKDARIAEELAILTCVDLRGRADPASAWWEWWDGVVHDDALAWFLGALARPAEGAPPVRLPARAAFDGEGTLEARLALVDAMDRPEAHLAERARRELARRSGRELGPLPARGPNRDVFLADLRRSLSLPDEQ